MERVDQRGLSEEVTLPLTAWEETALPRASGRLFLAEGTAIAEALQRKRRWCINEAKGELDSGKSGEAWPQRSVRSAPLRKTLFGLFLPEKESQFSLHGQVYLTNYKAYVEDSHTYTPPKCTIFVITASSMTRKSFYRIEGVLPHHPVMPLRRAWAPVCPFLGAQANLYTALQTLWSISQYLQNVVKTGWYNKCNLPLAQCLA